MIASSAEELFSVVHKQLTTIFAAGAGASGSDAMLASARGCKYGLNVLLQGLAIPDVARSLSQGVLRDVISLLLMRLVDDRSLLCFEEGPTLIKAVNVLMLKVLETSNRNYCYAVLLQLLRSPPTGTPVQKVFASGVVGRSCFVAVAGKEVASLTLVLLLSAMAFRLWMSLPCSQQKFRTPATAAKAPPRSCSCPSFTIS